MSNLELINKLKIKPEVNHEVGVKIMLKANPEEIIGPSKQTIINERKDNGDLAKEILEKINRNRLNKSVKNIEKINEIEPVSKAPPQIDKPKKKTKKISVKEIKFIEEDDDDVNVKPIEVEEKIQKVAEDRPIVVEEEDIEKPIKIKGVKKRRTKKPDLKQIEVGNDVIFGDTPLEDRLPKNPEFKIRTNNYYMNNREIFVSFINKLFEPYKDELADESKGITCDSIRNTSGDVSLLTHQRLVRDYMNLYTPYRGLLLYHGLGSGKTCSSIAIAEGMKSGRKVIVMTPASLKRNYMEQIKFCGDMIYRKNQFWEWIDADNNMTISNTLSKALSLPVEYIQRKNGAWMVNVTKPSNYEDLSSSDKKNLNEQLDEMIANKYRFINYNGLRKDSFSEMTKNYEENIFDNSVVIIDEAHNFISRIVNKINKSKNIVKYKFLALTLYDFLMKATNCKIVLLTGTPIINYPNEIAILFNILRGYIKTWSLVISSDKMKTISKETLMQEFKKEKSLDYIDYVPSSRTLTITRNPYGFESVVSESQKDNSKELKYKGVTNELKVKKNEDGNDELDEKGEPVYVERGILTDEQFISRIKKLLEKKNFVIEKNSMSVTLNKALPDSLEDFTYNFIDTNSGNVINTDKFKRRIIGLTSYFRSAQEELLPKYDKLTDRIIVYVEMSDYQFGKYEEYRHEERKLESKQSNKSKNDEYEFSSTYRIFSRLACNFAMPTPPGRPQPKDYSKKSKSYEDKFIAKIIEKLDEIKDIKTREQLTNEINKLNKIKKAIKENEMIITDVTNEYIEYFKKNYNPKKPKKIYDLKEFFEYKNYGNIFDSEIISEENDDKQEPKLVEDENQVNDELVEDVNPVNDELVEDEKQVNDELVEDENPIPVKEIIEKNKSEPKIKKYRSKNADDVYNYVFEIDKPKKKSKKEKVQKGGIGEDDDDVEDIYNAFVENNLEEKIKIPEYEDENIQEREPEELEADEILEVVGSNTYKNAINNAMDFLKLNPEQVFTDDKLAIYSPKFLELYENIIDEEYKGLHLLYSQFRSMEGIGIFTLLLEYRGFSRFKIKRTTGKNGWELDMTNDDLSKPCYALYTGTEDAEEKELIRNIYNSEWKYIPNNIASKLRERYTNNNNGEVIKLLMITSAGSEGINLHSTRWVHIVEPYWNPVRLEQVIGRARRICSHESLPVDERNVKVFIYISKLSKKQLESENSEELRRKDRSKKGPDFLPQTSDEKLLEILTEKERLSMQLLKAIKETSIDCATHVKSNSKEGLVCLSFGKATEKSIKDFSYNPDMSKDANDAVVALNKYDVNWKAKNVTIKGQRYVLRTETMQLYTEENYLATKENPNIELVPIGKLVKKDDKYVIDKEQIF
jgi:hypothetical protein